MSYWRHTVRVDIPNSHLIPHVLMLHWGRNERSQRSDCTLPNSVCLLTDCRPYSRPHFLICLFLVFSIGKSLTAKMFFQRSTIQLSLSHTLWSQQNICYSICIAAQCWSHSLGCIISPPLIDYDKHLIFILFFFPMGSRQYCGATMTPYWGNQTRQWV